MTGVPLTQGPVGATRNPLGADDWYSENRERFLSSANKPKERAVQGKEFEKGINPIKVDKLPTRISECPDYTDTEIGRAIRLRAEHWPVLDIADELNIDRSDIRRIFLWARDALEPRQ